MSIDPMIVLVDRDLGGSGTSSYHCSLWRIKQKRKYKLPSTSLYICTSNEFKGGFEPHRWPNFLYFYALFGRNRFSNRYPLR